MRGGAPGAGGFVALDFVAPWCAENREWLGPTNRMARAWKSEVALIEVVVFEKKPGESDRLARSLPHPLVAADERATLGGWLTERGGDYVPQSLLFGKNGRLMFSGQPFELPQTLAAVRGGTFDAAKVYALQRKREADIPARTALVAKVAALENTPRWRDAVKLLDREAGRYVPDQQSGLRVRKWKILARRDPAAARAWADFLAADPAVRAVPWTLHDIAGEIARKKSADPVDRAQALRLTNVLLRWGPTNPAYWDTLAQLLHAAGKRREALEAQESAVRFLGNKLDLTDDERSATIEWRDRYRSELTGK